MIDPARRRLVLHALALTAAVIALACAAWAAWDQGLTADEPVHLEWSRRLWETGETERTSNKHFDSKTPVSLANVAARKTAKSLGITDAQALRFAARLPNVVCLAALLAAVYAVTRRWAGAEAAAIALGLLSLDPNLVAHASVVTVDLPYALATLAVLAAGAAFGARPGVAWGAVLGLALAAAFATKFSAPLLVACLLAAPFRWRGQDRVRVGALAAGLVAAIVVWVIAVDAAYLFKGVGAPLSTVEWKSAAAARLAQNHPDLKLPLPIDFVTGLDRLIGHERSRAWQVIVLGERHPDGVWYYFLFHWLVKTPVLPLVATGAGLWWARRRAVFEPRLRLVAVALLVHVFYFSLVFRTQIGYRYVLMCLPVAAILAAAGLAERASARAFLPAAGLVAAMSLAEGLGYLGNPLSFTNVAVQPKRLVYRLIADSNVDWGQNDDKVPGWLAARGLRSHLNPVHILPGHNTVDLNLLAGVVAPEDYAWVREHLTPSGHLGHTHLLFEVTDEQFARFVAEARVIVPREVDARLCAGASGYERFQGSREARLGTPPAGEWPLVCFRVDAPADVSWEGTSGHAVFVRAGHRLKTQSTLLLPGHRVVFRLAPGVHAFAVGVQRDFEGRFVATPSAEILVASAPPAQILPPAE